MNTNRTNAQNLLLDVAAELENRAKHLRNHANENIGTVNGDKETLYFIQSFLGGLVHNVNVDLTRATIALANSVAESK